MGYCDVYYFCLILMAWIFLEDGEVLLLLGVRLKQAILVLKLPTVIPKRKTERCRNVSEVKTCENEIITTNFVRSVLFILEKVLFSTL